MEMASTWRKFFVEWPTCVPQRGVVVTSFEQVPFIGFMLQERFVLLERRAPDTVGGRRVLVPYDAILSVKIVDPVKNEDLTQVGFRQLATTAAQSVAN